MARRGPAGAVRLVRAHDPLSGGTTWVALSRSHPDVAYLLRAGPDGRPLCSCPRFGFRGDCAHVEALYALLRPAAMLTPKLAAGDTIGTKPGGGGAC